MGLSLWPVSILDSVSAGIDFRPEVDPRAQRVKYYKHRTPTAVITYEIKLKVDITRTPYRSDN